MRYVYDDAEVVEVDVAEVLKSAAVGLAGVGLNH